MSFYEDLGVSTSATEAEIKKAYFREVRQHPPESDSLGYQRVRSAYETLSDPQKRRSYDSTLRHGGRLATLEEEASAFMEEEDWASAENRFKEIILLDPERDAARNRLSLCMAYQDRHAEAVKILEQVIRRVPNDMTYRMNLGHCWLRRAIAEDDEGEFFEHALASFSKVIAHEPFHSDAWLMRARTEFRLERHDDAWTSAEKAVAADGKEDVGDLEALFFMVELAILSQHPERVTPTTLRIAQVTGDNADAREYATIRLLSFANQLIELKAFKAALRMQEAAAKLDPGNAEILAVRNRLQALVGSFSEFDPFKKDGSIPEQLRLAVAVWLAEKVGEDIDAKTKRNLDFHLPVWARMNTAVCLKGIRVIQAKYPSITTQVENKLNALLEILGAPATAGASEKESDGAGCIILFVIILSVSVLVGLFMSS